MRTHSLACAVALLASFVAVGAGSGASPRSCTTADFGVRVFAAKTARGVAVRAGVAGVAVPGCRLRAVVRLRIQQGRSRLTAAWRINRVLEFWAPFARRWIWRNWCGPRRGVRVTVTAPGDRAFVKVKSPPACRDRSAPTTVADAGLGRLPRSGGSIPAQMLSPETPVPVSPALLRVTNDWLVSNGTTLVAVYAGEAGQDPSAGRFVVIRQNLLFGYQTRSIVNVGPTGAVRITAAPLGRSVVTSAQHADIGFAAKSGSNGVLHLANDSVEIRF